MNCWPSRRAILALGHYFNACVAWHRTVGGSLRVNLEFSHWTRSSRGTRYLLPVVPPGKPFRL